MRMGIVEWWKGLEDRRMGFGLGRGVVGLGFLNTGV